MRLLRTARPSMLSAAVFTLVVTVFCNPGWAVQPVASGTAAASGDRSVEPETAEQSAHPAALPWLRTMGTRIVDEDGTPVKLRGVNVEGWLMWQGSIWGAGL